MELLPDIALQKRMTLWSRYLANLVVAIALMVLAGWEFDIIFLRRPIPNLVAMNPMSACAFLLCGIALLLLAPQKRTRQKLIIGRLLACLVIFIGFAKITGVITGTDIHMDYLLFPEKVLTTLTAGAPNAMAPNTAICFVLVGVALLLIDFETSRKKMPAHFIALLMGMIGMLSILGYLYQVEVFYSVLRYFSMAIHSAICFLFLAVAILFANPGKGLMRELTSTFSGSVTARLLIPAAILLPCTLGLLRLKGNWMGLYSNEFGVAIFALSIIVTFLFLIWFNTILLNRRDMQRIKAEEIIKESLTQVAYFADLIEKTSDGIVSFTPDFIVKSWNKGAEIIYGIKKEEAIGRSSREIFRQNYTIRELDEIREQLATKGYWNGEMEQYRNDGSKLICLMSTTELKDENGIATGYVSIAKDITKQREEDEKLKISEERFRLLINNVKDQAIFMLDETGKVASWNTGAQNMEGYTAEEIIGQPHTAFYTEEDLVAGEPGRNLEGARKNGYVERKGWRKRKDGSLFWANVVFTALYHPNGKLRGYSKVVKDISERKKAEEQISYLARLLEDTGDAVFSTDIDFHVRSWNRAAELFYGYTYEEVIGRPVAEIIRPQVEHELHERRRNELSAVGAFKGELVHLKKDGTPLVVLVTNASTRNEKGEIDGFVTVCRDISDRKNLEEKLKRSNEELEAFTYSVSHDLRAPLRAIIGFSTILEEDYGNKFDDEARRLIHIIKANTQKMGCLIDDLLNFSRMGRHEIIKTDIDSNNMVKDVIREQYNADNDRKIEWIIHPLPVVMGDINMIRQVWLNLVSNAIKYSGNAVVPVIEIGTFNKEQQVVFFVKDNGVGFDQQYAEKLFKVFQRLHSVHEFEGTGVGLAIIEKIVSKHGGNVWAEGTTNVGATFYFSLPATNEEITDKQMTGNAKTIYHES